MFRNRCQIIEAKDIKGGISAASWFLGGRIKGTISCQATPDGVLAGKLREAISNSIDGQMKLILEDGGISGTLV